MSMRERTRTEAVRRPADKGKHRIRAERDDAPPPIDDALGGDLAEPDPMLDLLLGPGQLDMREPVGGVSRPGQPGPGQMQCISDHGALSDVLEQDVTGAGRAAAMRRARAAWRVGHGIQRAAESTGHARITVRKIGGHAGRRTEAAIGSEARRRRRDDGRRQR